MGSLQHKISLWVWGTCYLVEKVMKLLSNSQGMCSVDRCCEYGWILPHRGLDNMIHLTYVSNLDQVARCWMYSLTHKEGIIWRPTKTHHMASIHTQKESSVVSLDIVHGSWQCGQGVGVDWIFDHLFDCNVNWCHPLHDENLCFECFISHSNEGENINGVLANLI